MLPLAAVEELVFCFVAAKAEAVPSVSAKTSAVASPSFFMIVSDLLQSVCPTISRFICEEASAHFKANPTCLLHL
jgi:hypothetical protein